MRKIIFFIVIFLFVITPGFSKWNRDGKREIIQSYEFIYFQAEYLIDQGIEKNLCDVEKLADFKKIFEKRFDPQLLEDVVDRAETKGIQMVEEIAGFYNYILEDDDTSYDFLEQIRDLIVLNPILIRQVPEEIKKYFDEKGIEFERLSDRIVKTRGFFYIDENQRRQHFNKDVYFYVPAKYISTKPIDFSSFGDLTLDVEKDSSTTAVDLKDCTFEFLREINGMFELPMPYIPSSQEEVLYLANSAMKKTVIQEEVKGFRFINGKRKSNENEGLTESEYEKYLLSENECYTDGAVVVEKPESGLNQGIFFTLDDGGVLLKGDAMSFTLIISASSFKPLPYRVDNLFGEIVYKPGRKSRQKIYESYESLYSAVVKLINKGLENEMGEYLHLNNFKEEFIKKFDPHKLSESIDEMETKGIKMIDYIAEFHNMLIEEELAYDEFLEDIQYTVKIHPLYIRQPTKKIVEEFDSIGINFKRIVSDHAFFISEIPVDFLYLFDASFNTIGIKKADQVKLEEFAKFIDAYPVSQDEIGILFLALYFDYLNEYFSLPAPYELTNKNGDFFFSYMNAIKQIQSDNSTIEGIRLFDFSNNEYITEEKMQDEGIIDEGLYFFIEGKLKISSIFRHYLWMYLNQKLEYIDKDDRPIGRFVVNSISFEPSEYVPIGIFE